MEPERKEEQGGAGLHATVHIWWPGRGEEQHSLREIAGLGAKPAR